MKLRTKLCDFIWDLNKAELNFRKHGVSFDIAATVFDDLLALTDPDSLHSDAEYRWISIGLSSEGQLLSVVHTRTEFQDGETVIRLISARRATARQHLFYECRGRMIQEDLPKEFDEEDYFDPSEWKKGRFAVEGPTIRIPLYLEPAIHKYFVEMATFQNTEARLLIDDILRREIDRIESTRRKRPQR